MDVTDRRSAEHVFVFFILSNINKLQAIKKIAEIRKWPCISNTNRDTDSTSVTVSENGSCHLIFHSRYLLMSIHNADNLYSYTLNYFAQICENKDAKLNAFREVEAGINSFILNTVTFCKITTWLLPIDLGEITSTTHKKC